MLSRVLISQFRSCRDVEIDGIGSFLALIGRNGAGKSNVLQAIEWASRVAASPDMKSIRLAALPSATSVTLEFSHGPHSLRYTVALTPASDAGSQQWPSHLSESLASKQASSDQWMTILKREAEMVYGLGQAPAVRLGSGAGGLAAIAGLLPSEESLTPMVQAAVEFLSNIRYYPEDQEPYIPEHSADDKSLVPGAAYQRWTRGYETTGDPGTSVIMRLLHMYLAQEEKFKFIKQVMGPNGLGLIHRFDITETQAISQNGDLSRQLEDKYFVFSFATEPGDESYFYSRLSTGTRRVLRTLVSLIFDGASLMLLEQPEDSLHPSLTKKLIDCLRANAAPTQIVVATHAAALLDMLKPLEVRLVEMQDGTTKVRPLTTTELDAAAKFMNREGSFSEFLEMVEET